MSNKVIFIRPESMGWGNIVLSLIDLVFYCKQNNIEPWVHDSINDVNREVIFSGFQVTSDKTTTEYKTRIIINESMYRMVQIPLIREIIKPSDYMNDLIQQNKHLVNDVCCGIHIRRGAFSNDSSEIGCHGYKENGTIKPAYFATDEAVKKFEEIVDKTDGKIFIASDSKELKKSFKEKFGNKINFLETDIALTYHCDFLKNKDTKQNRINCYLEWFLLSMCPILHITAGNRDLTDFSTFGYTAGVYGKSELNFVFN
jgi:hypothetical protein